MGLVCDDVPEGFKKGKKQYKEMQKRAMPLIIDTMAMMLAKLDACVKVSDKKSDWQQSQQQKSKGEGRRESEGFALSLSLLSATKLLQHDNHRLRSSTYGISINYNKKHTKKCFIEDLSM